MKIAEKYADLFGRILPGPLAIAVILTFITFLLALLNTGIDAGLPATLLTLSGYWEQGIWNGGLLVFAFQMMLMLILGHVLALTRPAEYIIDKAMKYCETTASAAFTVTLATILVSLFNWGLGLIFGAIFARKVAERASLLARPLNYPLIGAAGYSGLMVWHAGISGSSLVKVAEPGHLKGIMNGIYSEAQISLLPEALTFSETVFSSMNLTAIALVVLIIPAAMFLMGKVSKSVPVSSNLKSHTIKIHSPEEATGADRMNFSPWLSRLFAALLFLGVIARVVSAKGLTNFSFITPDFINLSLLFLCMLLAANLNHFVQLVDEAISGASGILIQFPLYFGIMGLMKDAGLVETMSSFFIAVSSPVSFPIFTYISAGLVNIFVPSGGGQWAIQGPIIIQTAESMGLSLPKCILALAYGDQLTNMLQPFWALPLLGITGLNAREILPYTLYLMLIGGVIFLGVLFYL